MHPLTYVNKLVFGQGNRLELWNIIDDSKIFEFVFSDMEKAQTSIECVVQSPVIHTVAVGFENGAIKLVNLLYNEVLFTFNQTEG